MKSRNRSFRSCLWFGVLTILATAGRVEGGDGPPAQPAFSLGLEAALDSEEPSEIDPEIFDDLPPPDSEHTENRVPEAVSESRRILVGGMTTTSWILTGVFAVGGGYVLNSGSADDAEALGDLFQYLLPASAWGSTWLGRDWPGALQYTVQFGAGTLTTYGLKYSVEKRTPSAADYDSFPSAHTQAAFSGASFIHRRWGPRWGVPAYVLAGFTGLSRVKAERHYLDDVISGMSIALISGWTFVSPIEDRVTLNPILVDRGAGVSLGIRGGASTGATGEPSTGVERRWSYTWEVGRAEVLRNAVSGPTSGGDEIDFRFRERNNPLVTSSLEIARRLGPRHELSTRLAPFEVREEEQFSTEVEIGGIVFDPSEILETRFVGYDWRTRWRYRVDSSRWLRFRAGAGVDLLAIRSELTVTRDLDGPPGKNAREEEFEVVPIAHLHLGAAPWKRGLFYLEIDGSVVPSQTLIDWSTGFRWRVGSRWDLSFVHRRVDWAVEGDSLENDFELQFTGLRIGYRW